MDNKSYTVVVEGNTISGGCTGDSSTCATVCQSVKAIGRGFCFDCDRPVEIEYDTRWVGDYQPKTCRECDGSDVEFMGRVAERLWKRTQQVADVRDELLIWAAGGPKCYEYGRSCMFCHAEEWEEHELGCLHIEARRLVRQLEFNKRLEQALEQHADMFRGPTDK